MIYFSTYLQDLKKSPKTPTWPLYPVVWPDRKRMHGTVAWIRNLQLTQQHRCDEACPVHDNFTQLPESKWSCFMSEPDHPLTHYSRTELGVANDEALFDS